MAKMIDTEGEKIPDDYDGTPLFDMDLIDWGDGRGPVLTVNGPKYFETESEIYDSEGIFTVPLRDVLEQYATEMIQLDGGDSAPQFIAYLRQYATRLEQIIAAKPADMPSTLRGLDLPHEPV